MRVSGCISGLKASGLRLPSKGNFNFQTAPFLKIEQHQPHEQYLRDSCSLVPCNHSAFQDGGVDPILAPLSRRGTEGSLVLGQVGDKNFMPTCNAVIRDVFTTS